MDSVLTQLPGFTWRQMKTRTMMMKVVGLDATAGLDITEVEIEAPVVVKVEVAGKHSTTAESLSTFRNIVVNRVTAHVMRKTKGMALEI